MMEGFLKPGAIRRGALIKLSAGYEFVTAGAHTYRKKVFNWAKPLSECPTGSICHVVGRWGGEGRSHFEKKRKRKKHLRVYLTKIVSCSIYVPGIVFKYLRFVPFAIIIYIYR